MRPWPTWLFVLFFLLGVAVLVLGFVEIKHILDHPGVTQGAG